MGTFSMCTVVFSCAHRTLSERGDVRHTVSVVLVVVLLKNCWPSGCVQGKWRQFVLSSFLQLSFCDFLFSSPAPFPRLYVCVCVCVCVRGSAFSFLLLSHLQVYPMYYAYPVTLHFCCALVKCATVGKWRSQKHWGARRTRGRRESG